ncbi:YceI family protein [Myroides sp. M-43]|uniref:YceI family protein n=1 Tax=Myroides oncorhynchi TaxID=2893756 RepID=UPI001E4ED854|nr:YceI family protein [Myroides oncorhynchi]MCC9042726.1 YceI family protein [Myroides oncorhynchi]
MANTVWNIDPTHSEIGFKVKHMMFTNVSGKFNEFTSTVTNKEEGFETSEISFTAKVASIDTNNVDRDNHLRSADFFEVEEHEDITFASTDVQKKSVNDYVITGLMTIKGVTKEVVFNAEYSGLLTDPWGNTKIALSLEGKINRKEFGLGWNTALETGGVLVGEDIKLFAEVQFAKA